VAVKINNDIFAFHYSIILGYNMQVANANMSVLSYTLFLCNDCI